MLLTVAAFALLAAAISLVVAPGLRGVLGAALALLMIAIAAVDLRRFIVRDALTAASLALALVHAAVQDPFAIVPALAAAILRAAAVALVFWAIRETYRRLTGRDGLGLGDVKLAGVAGAWLDWITIPIAIEVAAVGALAVYALHRLATRRPIRRLARVPFGLFLAPSIWLGWLLEVMFLAAARG